jgi:nucleoside-diphosphate-sugar epimerase
MSDGPLLLTGGSGFVGRRVLRELHGRVGLRLLVHERQPEECAGSDPVAANLEDPASLRRICDGVRTVVHLASYIGDDARRCDRVNAHGTEALVASARAAGVERIIYLSNAAVYGYAVHRGADESSAVVAPATPISRSRAAAEQAVLGAGGSVIRPLFVYGEGDTRFIPAIARAIQRFPFIIDGGRARLSVIAVSDLSRIIGALALREPDDREAGVFHATDGQPISFREIVALVASLRDGRMPSVSVPYPLARALVRLTRLGRRWTASDAHRLFLVSRDHFYDSSRAWRLTGLSRPEHMGAQFEACAAWYRTALGTEQAG